MNIACEVDRFTTRNLPEILSPRHEKKGPATSSGPLFQIKNKRRVGRGNFTPSPSQIRA